MGQAMTRIRGIREDRLMLAESRVDAIVRYCEKTIGLLKEREAQATAGGSPDTHAMITREALEHVLAIAKGG
jgi:hypothetical protein